MGASPMRYGDPSRQSGFVLLMTLVLLLMSVVALAGMAHRSIIAALDSRTAVEDLQRRWAITSIRSTLVGRIEKLLDIAERGRVENGMSSDEYLNAPMSQLRVSCRLSGIDYELVLTDEQAKLNLNHLLKSDNRHKARSIVRRLVNRSGSVGGKPAAVNLLGIAGGMGGSKNRDALPAIGSYSQVFKNASPDHLVGRQDAIGLAADITCWGDGKVNLRRASDEVVRYACGNRVGHDLLRELLAERKRDPYRGLSGILGALDKVDDKQKTALKECLTDKSTCHGLWIISRGRRRSWHNLAISTGRGAGGSDPGQWSEFGW